MENRTLVYDYKEKTSGVIVSSFDELLKALDQIDAIEINEKKSKEIINEFWQYDQDDKMVLKNYRYNFKI